MNVQVLVFAAVLLWLKVAAAVDDGLMFKVISMELCLMLSVA